MEQKLKFTVHSLLEKIDGEISGPEPALRFAEKMAVESEFKFNRLARVRFEDPEILQRRTDQDGGLTAWDCLIIGCRYAEGDFLLSLWINTGIVDLPVALRFLSEKRAKITPAYKQFQWFAKKLTEQEITQIFNYVFENPEVLDIKEKRS